MWEALRTGAVAGALAGLVLGVLEFFANFGDIIGSGTPWYAALLVPLFYGAVLVPTLALFGGALNGWLRLGHGKSSNEVAALWKQHLAELRDGSLYLHGLAVGLPLFALGVVGLALAVHLTLHDQFNNPVLAGLLQGFMVLTVAVLWWNVVRGTLRGLGRFVRWLQNRSPQLEVWLRGPRLLGLIGAVGLLLIAVVASAGWATVSAIGEGKLFWLLVGPLVLVASLVFCIAQSHVWMAWKRKWIAVAAVLLLVPAALGLGDVQTVRQAGLFESGPTPLVVRWAQALTDFDGDGASSLFGGPDCAPFNAAIGPDVAEIPGNGIDDNCVGSDASPNSGDDGDAGLRYRPLPKAFPSRPDIVLITIDTLRADHMSLYGYDRSTTPRIDAHAKNAVVFERAYSQGPDTVASMPSLFAGVYPSQVILADQKKIPTISPKETLLAEYLSEAGYFTGAVTCLRPTYDRKWGLTQGFEWLDVTLSHPDPGHRETTPKAVRLAADFVKHRRKQKQPYFLWLHLYDVHSEYRAHPKLAPFGKRPVDLYDGEIVFTDLHVGELLDLLFKHPESRPTVVALASDHGEGFTGDRGKRYHGYGLFEEQIRTPLIVWAPGAKGQRVASPVGNLDLTATFLNVAGMNEPRLMGRSLISYMFEGFSDPKRLVFSSGSAKGQTKGPRRKRKSAVDERWKYIRWIDEGREFLFDLDHDAAEKTNVINDHPAEASRLRTAMDNFMNQVSIKRPPRPPPKKLELADSALVSKVFATNGRGGRKETWNCPRGYELSELWVRTQGQESGSLLVAGLNPRCRLIEGSVIQDRLSEAHGGWRGLRDRTNRRPVHKLKCPDNQLPVGLYGRAGELVDALGMLCLQGRSWSAKPVVLKSKLVGNPKGGRPFTFRCPNGSVMWGLRGRSGSFIDAAGLACVPLKHFLPDGS